MFEVHEINEDAWDEWVEYRHSEIKKKIGPMAEKKQKKMLMQYPPPVQQKIIDASIMNSWQGLFPEKVTNNANSRSTSNGVQQHRKPTVAERLRDDIAALEGRSRA